MTVGDWGRARAGRIEAPIGRDSIRAIEAQQMVHRLVDAGFATDTENSSLVNLSARPVARAAAKKPSIGRWLRVIKRFWVRQQLLVYISPGEKLGSERQCRLNLLCVIMPEP